MEMKNGEEIRLNAATLPDVLVPSPDDAGVYDSDTALNHTDNDAFNDIPLAEFAAIIKSSDGFVVEWNVIARHILLNTPHSGVTLVASLF